MEGLPGRGDRRRDQARFSISVVRTRDVLATEARVASSLVKRMVGLLNHAHLERGEALILPACRSIHTCFMRFAIDVVFVDRSWRVVATRYDLSPWRMTPWFWNAWAAIELAAGTLPRLHMETGDLLAVEPQGGHNDLQKSLDN
jgi:uncharacterized membrane protein (UPF0127 family)